MSDEENAEYDLVMPFVVVTSKGGPYDDDAYVAGYEMGELAGVLSVLPPSYNATIRTANVPQADLIAMRHGYRCEAAVAGQVPEWTHVSFEPASGGEAQEG